MATKFTRIEDGVSLLNLGGTPSSLANGDVWYQSGFKFREGGVTKTLFAGTTWTEVTGTTQTIAVNNAYIANNASQVAFTLPSTAAVGDSFIIVYKGAGGWRVAQNAGQSIMHGTGQSATGITGDIYSGGVGACVEVVCITADTVFEVRNFNGTVNITMIAAGYFGGGWTGSSHNLIDKLTYSTEVRSAVADTLDTAVREPGAASSSSAGYWGGGGTTGSGSSGQTIIQKMTFGGTEVTTTIAAVLDTGKIHLMGGQSSTKGYYAGGINTSSSATTSIRALTFSGETAATLGATLGTAKYGAAPTSSSTKFYMWGGDGAAVTNIIQALTFSGESTATISATMGTATFATAGTSSSSAGYAAGGQDSGGTPQTRIEKLTFPGETRSTLSATIGTAKPYLGGSFSTTKGYFAGGNNGGTYYDSIDALVFSGETASVLSAVLGTGRRIDCGCQG